MITGEQTGDFAGIDQIGEKPENPFEIIPENILQEMKDIFVEARNFKLYDPNVEPAAKTWNSVSNGVRSETLSSDYEETISRMGTFYLDSRGIEEDKAVDILCKVYESFSEEILKDSLVSGIELRLDLVNVQLPRDNPFELDHGEYCIPVEMFEKFWNTFNEEQKKCFSEWIFRGESFANWFRNGHTKGRYFASPVVLYNQDYDSKNIGLMKSEDPKKLGLEYLESIDLENRREVYHVGSVNHEIAHNIYAYLVHGTPLEVEWRQAVDRNGNITNYAQFWEEKTGIRDYDENFAEAVRLYTTIPNFMNDKRFISIKEFIANNFPNIKAAQL